ncbi:LOW QUALITY PROTEIN: hypothetical protein CVT25_011871 [Psilocybe cyanescens]|uniref:Uncharacterized protein n=1 Tax=Psilocybe cyanescens TaxID=93625 RepID=A0A409XCD8_PSICY|nr:LOW QUALITY PROTEIN: hypothetical protein CVT25_011871 [Psilocybe cyanescens]
MSSLAAAATCHAIVVITFDRENRYYGLVTASCKHLYHSILGHSTANNLHEGLRVAQWEGITALLGCIVADVTLQVRIYALYSGSKRILALMLTTYVLCVTASGWVVGTALVNGKAFVVPLPIGSAICDLSVIPLHLYAFWIPMITFQVLLCILAIIPAINSFKADGSIMKFYSGHGLYNILILWVVEPKVGHSGPSYNTFRVNSSDAILHNDLIETPIGFALAIQCSLCNRIILNLREADQLVVSDNDTQESVMVYASRDY